MVDLASLRTEYTRGGLAEGDVAADPVAQFQRWLGDAVAAGLRDPNAVTLATASADGTPHARIVLVKGADARGVTFFTNYDSHKGRELAENPRAALVSFWAELDRQVRIEGDVTPVSREETEAYFASRPLGSQLGAWASPQSEVVSGRPALEASYAAAEARFADGPVPAPPHWGGFRLSPSVVEFWQGRPSRLHDRLRYSRGGGGAWRIDRLAP